jgi:hypothetical protein
VVPLSIGALPPKPSTVHTKDKTFGHSSIWEEQKEQHELQSGDHNIEEEHILLWGPLLFLRRGSLCPSDGYYCQCPIHCSALPMPLSTLCYRFWRLLPLFCTETHPLNWFQKTENCPWWINNFNAHLSFLGVRLLGGWSLSGGRDR